MNPKIPVLLNKGKLKFQPEGQSYISAQSDGWYLFTISKPKSSRTNQMNRYYWGVMIKMIAEETGYDDDQVHQLMKYKFGVVGEEPPSHRIRINPMEYKDDPVFDGNTNIPKSTAKYTVEEMQDYWQRITQWAAEFLGLQIPEPNEVEY